MGLDIDFISLAEIESNSWCFTLLDLSSRKTFDFDPVNDGPTELRLFFGNDLRPDESFVGIVELFNDFESTKTLFVDDSTLRGIEFFDSKVRTCFFFF